ncbi:hypothetical protein BU26DRAFT_538329 [Trematosphaeria pertusa]|uniref:SnoaL-like domain-containing protein n=1 Tax=Trematosphaeria pertusa TaxID=390896 RepID=A0A6A6IT71_9PLEO|nr:uncharacterized protein BU26DRAFT_538329 [Trematosphaeria pertusa]KAF2253596.1 hypothetical protein BU26DRAFT_538329 [Trematosphaeria pertusa]
MVNITSAAQAAATAYGALIALGGDYTYPLSNLSVQISSFFLPNYTAFSLGEISVSPNASIVAERFISEYTTLRTEGPGTVVKVTDSRVEVVSDQSALCWLTYRISPQQTNLSGWDWTNVYGFRAVEGGLGNGLDGGWEFAVADQEHEEMAKRYPDLA